MNEYWGDYVSVISRFHAFGIHPELTKKILIQVKAISKLEFAGDYPSSLKTEAERIEKQIERLNAIQIKTKNTKHSFH